MNTTTAEGGATNDVSVVFAGEFMRLLGLRRARFYDLAASGALPEPLRMPGVKRWARKVVVEFLSGERPARKRW